MGDINEVASTSKCTIQPESIVKDTEITDINIRLDQLGNELEVHKNITDAKIDVVKYRNKIDIDKINKSLSNMADANNKLNEEFKKLQDIFLKMCFILPLISVGITLMIVNFIK